MYPYFIIHWYKIYAVWVWIVVSAILAIFVTWFFVKRYKLQFGKFFYRLPTLIIFTYLLGNWAGLLFDQGIRFPFGSWKAFLSLLSPYWYDFHFVGLVAGAAYARHRFFKKIYMKSEENKWINVFFFAFTAALIPLWLFLLLGDTFVGKATDSWYGVMALLNDSALTNYWYVLPLGIMLSAIAFLTYIIIFFCKKFFSQQKVWWYLGFSILFFLFNILFIGEIYVRHAPLSIWWFTFDIKNYVTTFIAICFFVRFRRSSKIKAIMQ